MISCAIRERVRLIASSSRRTLVEGVTACCGKTTPFRPRGTGLKGLGRRRIHGLPDSSVFAGVGKCATLHEARLAALGKRNLDRVEVAWYDGCREDLARLAQQLWPEVTRRDMRQGEQAD